MSNLVLRLPRYYQESPPVAELERVLGLEVDALRDARDDTLAQLWVDTATWGLERWERWCGLPTDPSLPYSQRRQRVLAKLRGQGTTTAEMIANVVASFGFSAEQVSVIEHPGEYAFEVVLSDLAEQPADVSPIQAAVDEIKPAHLEWWFTYVLSQLLATARPGGAYWRMQETTLPALEPAKLLTALRVGGDSWRMQETTLTEATA